MTSRPRPRPAPVGLPGAWLWRMPLAFSVFGLRQMAAMAAPSSGPGLHLSSLGWRTLDPLACFLGTLEEGAAAAELAIPPCSPALRELRNKVAAFAGFRYAPQIVKGGREATTPISGLQAWKQLWALEGLGYHQIGRSPQPDLEGPALAADSLPLHTGRGLALAERFITEAGESGPLDGPLARFDEDCRRHAEAGCWQASFENLGLMLQLLRSRRLLEVSSALGRDTEREALLWHGAGRGLYFAFPDLPPLPGRSWNALRRAGAAPSPAARNNAVAGVAWAVTMVNLLHPEVVQWRLGEEPQQGFEDALEDGMTAAATVWLLCTGDAASLGALAASSERTRQACHAARDQRWPDLRRTGAFGQLFRLEIGGSP